MEGETVKRFYRQQSVVEHYSRASNNVGLWNSEEKILTRLFSKEDSLLELGCGAGRISLGLWELGYEKLTATDYSKEMVREAKRINHILGYKIFCQVADATTLRFAEDSFDGAIFGFNGLMQIPGRENRQRAIQEIFRVLVPGAFFFFTSHDRERWNKGFAKEERKKWNDGKQHPELTDFGDVYYEAPEGGYMFIHAPTPQEVRHDLKLAGFRVESDVMRSQFTQESESVRDFSDDCRLWIAQKPVKKANQPQTEE